MVSVTTSVHNHTDNFRFLGLMGINFPVEEFESKVPMDRLSPLGYAFILNVYGHVVIHPSIRPEAGMIGDKHDLDWFDLELDVSDAKSKIKVSMVDNLQGDRLVEELIQVTDDVHTYLSQRLYTYRGIPSTDFGVSFVTANHQDFYVKVEKPEQLKVTKSPEGRYSLGDVSIQWLVNQARVLLPQEMTGRELLRHFYELPDDLAGYPEEDIVPEGSQPISEAAPDTLVDSSPANESTTVQTDSLTVNDISPGAEVSDPVPSAQDEQLDSTQTPGIADALRRVRRQSENTLTDNPSSLSVDVSGDGGASGGGGETAPLIGLSPSSEENSVTDTQDTGSSLPSTVGSEPLLGSADLPVTGEPTVQLAGEEIVCSIDSTSPTTTTEAAVKDEVTPQTQEDVPNRQFSEFLEKVMEAEGRFSNKISQLLFDILVTERYLEQYFSIWNLTAPDVQSRSIALNSGLTVILPAGRSEAFEDELQQSPISPIFQRVLDADGFVFWLPIKHESHYKPIVEIKEHNETEMLPDNLTQLEHNMTEIDSSTTKFGQNFPTNHTDDAQMKDVPTPLPSVTIFSTLVVDTVSPAYKAGVMGVTLTPEFLARQLKETPGCEDPKMTVCYLLEDSAYIVAVNDDELNGDVGRFLGYVDPPLMHSLLNGSVYQVIQQYKFHDPCVNATEDPRTTSPGARPTFAPLLYIKQALSLTLWKEITTTFVVSLFDVTRTVVTWSLPLVNRGMAMLNKPTACSQLLHRYYPSQSEIYPSLAKPSSSSLAESARGQFNCSAQCQRSWGVRGLPRTNLKLLLVDPVCGNATEAGFTCYGWEKPPFREPVRERPGICEGDETPRYRRKLPRCQEAANLFHEDATCGSNSLSLATAYLLSTAFISCHQLFMYL